MKLQNKVFWVLFGLSVLSAILVLPYALTVQKDMLSNITVSMPILILASIIQSAIIFAVAVFFGNILARKIGFRTPLLEAWLGGKRIRYAKTLKLSVLSGIIVGIVILALDWLVFPQGIGIHTLVWQGLLASFYGGIGEEVLMRFFLMSLLVFIMIKLTRRKTPGPIIVWSSILVIAVLFGLGHLPITSAVTPITAMVVLRAILLNGIGGVVFGWLYWKKGLESAIIAHFCADIILHVIVPLLGMSL